PGHRPCCSADPPRVDALPGAAGRRAAAGRTPQTDRGDRRAGAAGVGGGVSPLKNGRAKAVRFSTLTLICDVLDCQPGDLLSIAPRPTTPGIRPPRPTTQTRTSRPAT